MSGLVFTDVLRQFLGIGPVGDDDLSCCHIPGTPRGGGKGGGVVMVAGVFRCYEQCRGYGHCCQAKIIQVIFYGRSGSNGSALSLALMFGIPPTVELRSKGFHRTSLIFPIN